VLRSRPAPLRPSLIEAIADRYGIVPVGPGRRLSGRGRLLLVRTSAGEKVLRRYRADWPEASVLCEHSILQQLARIGFPAVRLSTPESGPSWLVLDGERYALYDFVPGSDMSWAWLGRTSRVRLVASAGRLLASYHLAMLDFVPAAEHHLTAASKDPSGATASPFAWSSLVARAEQAAGIDLDEGLRRQILTELHRAHEETRLTALPEGVIHGDYGLHNLRYSKTEPTLMDFELARAGWPLHDVAMALHRMCGGAVRFDSTSTAVFLAAYEDVRPLEEHEWDALPDAWIHRRLRDAVRHFAAGSGSTRHANEQARSALADADWVRQNRARVSRVRTRR
jgi:Ser/Thr protein kinase RdoA (MazF antagonist)